MTYFLNQSVEILIVIPIVGIVYMGLLYILVVTTFFLASFVDPGIYPRGEFVLVCGWCGWCVCVWVGYVCVVWGDSSYFQCPSVMLFDILGSQPTRSDVFLRNIARLLDFTLYIHTVHCTCIVQ